MNNKLLIAGVITASALLGGCSNNAESEENIANLTNQVSELTEKVDGLASDHQKMQSKMESRMQAATDEAERANSRIDNIADSYKK